MLSVSLQQRLRLLEETSSHHVLRWSNLWDRSQIRQGRVIHLVRRFPLWFTSIAEPSFLLIFILHRSWSPVPGFLLMPMTFLSSISVGVLQRKKGEGRYLSNSILQSTLRRLTPFFSFFCPFLKALDMMKLNDYGVKQTDEIKSQVCLMAVLGKRILQAL